MKTILASTSPYRIAQLKAFGLDFTAKKPLIDESQLKLRFRKLKPRALSRRLAIEKAKSLSLKFQDAVILGADQVLCFNEKAIDKPLTIQNNIAQLEKMQGKTHELITSMALYYGGRYQVSTVTARIRLRKLNKQEIVAYVKRDRAIDCAGGYKFEKSGYSLVEDIRVSDPSSLIGLSLVELPKLFSKLKVPIRFR